MKKLLVLGIIALFIGVGIQPVFADESITTLSNIEEDCNCNDEFNDNDKSERLICKFLERLISYFAKLGDFFLELADKYPGDSYLYNIFINLAEIMEIRCCAIVDFGASIDCWDYPYPL